MDLLKSLMILCRPARVVAAGAVLLAGAAAGAATPENQNAVEYAVKAAYLYKFGAFIEWPVSAFASAGSPATLCVVGDDPFGAMLDQAVVGQRIADRPIAVRRLKQAEAHSGCQIIYIAGRDANLVAETMAKVRGENVLTITDGSGRDAPAGIINFVIANNRVRFEIDDGAAAVNGLTISSKLLALASAVKPRG